MTQVMVICGEASGDKHAAAIIEKLQQQHQQALKVFGIGGATLAQAGCEICFPMAKLSVMGGVEILKKLSTIRQAMHTVEQLLSERRPDLLILVDFAGFNLRVAKKAKALGIKVVYFIGPHVWLWRKYRIHTIKRCVDHMAVIFPNDVAFYQQHGVPVTYVGNPTANATQAFLAQQPPQLTGPITIGLFPGSRQSEIKRLLPEMIGAALLLKQRYPTCRFILPVASTLDIDAITQACPPDLDIDCSQDTIQELIQQCHVIMSASGTVTLEIALLQVPQVICYKLNVISAILAKMILNLPFYALCNLLTQTEVGKELLQLNCTANNLAKECIRLLEDKTYREEKLALAKALQDYFGTQQCTEETVKVIDAVLAA